MNHEGTFPTRLRRALVAAVGLFMLAQIAPAQVEAVTPEEIRKAERRVRQLRGELDAATARLEQTSAEIDVLTARITQALRQREDLQFVIGDTKEKIQRKGKRIENLQTMLDNRAREAYIAGPAGVFELLLDAESLTELSDRASFLGVLNRADGAIAVGIDFERDQLKLQRSDLKGYLEEQERLLADLARQQGELEALWAEQASLTEEIEDKLAEAQQEVKKLRRERRREIIAALAAYNAQVQSAGGAPTGPPPEADGPFFYCPVDPPRSYSDDFGVPRPGGRSHQGNDVFAPSGTPIRAVFDGEAREGSNGLGGLTVHLYASNGSGDYVYNAHLSAYAGVSGQVKAGTIIGYVGNTGNAVGTPPHDHFEYHPGGGSAVSPYVYLNEVCV